MKKYAKCFDSFKEFEDDSEDLHLYYNFFESPDVLEHIFAKIKEHSLNILGKLMESLH